MHNRRWKEGKGQAMRPGMDVLGCMPWRTLDPQPPLSLQKCPLPWLEQNPLPLLESIQRFTWTPHKVMFIFLKNHPTSLPCLQTRVSKRFLQGQSKYLGHVASMATTHVCLYTT